MVYFPHCLHSLPWGVVDFYTSKIVLYKKGIERGFSDFLQVLFPVIEEIPVDTIIIRVLVSDLVDTTTIKAIDLCIRVGKDYRGMSGDDELHISTGA
jgi:hypothetical protein